VALGGDADASAFQVGERDLVALAFIANEKIRREFHVLEDDLRRVGTALAHLLLDRGDPVALPVRRHDEGGNALLFTVRIGDGENDGYIGVFAGCDELLGAVEDVAVAVAPGPALDGRSVRSCLRFREHEGTQVLAAGEAGQEARFLLLGAVSDDDHLGQGLHAHDRRGGTVAAGDLFHGETVGNVVDAGAAPVLGDQHAHQAEFTHLLDLIGGKAGLAVSLERARCQALGGELAGHIADQGLFFREVHDLQPTRARGCRRN